MPQQLTDTQQIVYTLSPKDRKGNTAAVDGIPAWTSSNSLVADVVPADDGMSATVKAGVPGDATVSVSADADLGEGVTTLAATVDIHVVPGAAVTADLTAGAVSEQGGN